MNHTSLLLGFGLGPWEIAILGMVGVLLFGKRLPEVGRSLGRSWIEFQRGLHGFKDEMNATVNSASVSSTPSRSSFHEIDDRDESTAPKFDPPKFDPPKAEPKAESRDESVPA